MFWLGVTVFERVALVGVLAATLTLAGAEDVSAHDSLAPPRASHRWLPQEEWVSRHWIPFDERRLNLALGLHRRELEGFLYNDHRVLAELARRRGIDLEQLTDHLLAPWRSRVEVAASGSS